MPKIWRIIDLIHWAESYFQEKGFRNPRAEIEWLLRSVLDCSRMDVYLRFEEPLSQSQLETLRTYVKRRLNKEPLQYITGSCDFYGRNYFVNEIELLETMKPLVSTENLWKPHALLLLGDYFVSKKEYLKAKEFFLQVLSLKNLNKAFYQKAQSQLLQISNE